jgi:hypothetical protein
VSSVTPNNITRVFYWIAAIDLRYFIPSKGWQNHEIEH